MNNIEKLESIGGRIFDSMKTDHRVNPDLDYCLYCSVTDTSSNTTLPYKIKLDCINGNSIKQCPACKKIYILTDQTLTEKDKK